MAFTGKLSAAMGFLIIIAVLIAGCGPASSISGIPQPPQGGYGSGSSTPNPAPGQSPSSSSVSSPSPLSTKVGSVNDFPRLVQAAMAHVPRGLISHPWAPTMLPNSQYSGLTVHHYHLGLSTHGTIKGYSIALMAKSHDLTHFGAYTYPSAGRAQKAIQGNPDGTRGAGQTVGRAILGHYSATIRRYSHTPGTSVSWQESGWHVVVNDYTGTNPPVAVAKEAAADLSGAALPAHQGVLDVNLNHPGSPQVQAALNWQNGPVVYFVDVNAPAMDPVAAVIQLAGSFQLYPAKHLG